MLVAACGLLGFSASAQALPDGLTLTPEAAENPIGTSHTLTATVTDAGKPVEGVQVGFSGDINLGACQEGLGSRFVVTDASGKANCTYTGVSTGLETITAFADTNKNFVIDAGEPSDTATKRWRSAPATSVTLEPKSDVNIVGAEACVIARAKNATGPAGDQTVSFTVTGANPTSQAPTTDASGDVSFCYTGANSGLDTITAFVDSNNNQTKDASEPEDTATKHWLANQPSLALAPKEGKNLVGTSHTLTATVTDAGKPVEGVQVGFSGDINLGACQEGLGSRFVVTDASGKANCTYTGVSTGLETITAFADTNKNFFIDNGESGDTATDEWTSEPATSVTLEPKSDVNIVGAEACVIARAKNATGPAGDQTVSFTVTGANPTSQAPTTDASGDVSFCYTGANSGLDTITAFVDSNNNQTKDASEPEDTATKHWLANQPSLALAPKEGKNLVGTSHTLTATVTDAGKPVEGVQVGFSGDINLGACQEGLGSRFVVTDASGKANCTYTGVSTGLETITAFADTNKNFFIDNGESGDTATDEWTSEPATSVTLEPKSDVNIVGAEACVIARAKNATGPAGDQTVSFTVTGANPTSQAPTTDASGDVSFCYTGANSGLDTITAFVDSNNNQTKDASEPEDTATKHWLANQPSLALAPKEGKNLVGTSHTLTATVTDAGKPVEGVQVGFSGDINLGACQEGLGSRFVVTDASGKANCTYTGVSTGLETITAFADTNKNFFIDNGEPSDTATDEWTETPPPPATSLTMTPSAATNVVNVQHCLTAIARLEGGEPAANRSVLFTVTGANASPAAERTTESSGAAQFCYTGTNAGQDTITAFVDNDKNGQLDAGDPQATATKLWLSQPPDSLVLTPPDATNPTNTTHTVTATVTDHGSPIANVKVVFNIRGTSQGSTNVTDANGQASFTYSSAFERSDTIDAFADTNGNGTRDPDEPLGTATKTWTVMPPSTLTLSPSSATNPINTQHCVTATVKDASDRLQGNRTVRFSVTGTNAPQGAAISTDFAGEAEFCYTGTLAGQDTISAFVDTNNDGVMASDGTEPSGTATKTWTGVATPTVTTEAASAVSQTAATLNATVNPNGGEVSKCEFEYGTTTAYDKTAPCSSLPGNGSSAVAVSASISGLSANTTYHFRISATNPTATSKGSDESFKTLPAPTEPPTVTTEAASAVSQTAATLNATVNPNGGEVSKCEFEYGTTTAYDKTAPCSSLPGNGSSAVAVSASISGLSANTTYHFRISATNPTATSKGSDESFKTLPAPTEPPTVTTEAASAVSQTAATLNATVNPNGGEVSKCEFEYGTTTAYDKTAPCSSLPGNGSSAVAVSASISGLSANTTYHFRISATNPSATSKGSDESFKTLPAPTEPPTVTTEAASAVSQTAATLNATVNPNGGEVSKCEFEYGTTTAYDKTAPCSSLPGNGSSAVAVSASISGLSANTTYHFRISATNPSATSKGSDESFKTLPAPTEPPTVTTEAASAVSQTAATLNATVNPNGGEVSKCEFEYGTTTAYDKTAPCSSLPGNGSSAVAVSASISGLSANTTYHFRISATNPTATSKGSDESFKTLPAPTEPPTVTTEAASAVSQTAATLNATVNPNGGEVSKCEFEYGTTTAYDKTAPCSSLPGNGSSAVAVSASISGLSANTTYHFRISATNPSATSKGSDESFKTLPAPTEPPTVTTEAASAVSQTAATLNATVNPNGGEVSKCEFEYGTTTAYDKTAPCSSLPGNGSSAVAVSASISGLSANTTYHFRISATNPSATSKGSDESFKTLPAPTEPPTVTTEAASAVSQTAATLNATVNPNGGEVSKCEFEYGTTTAYDKTAPCSSLPGNGSSAVAVSASISGLSANTTYHFRISATNPSATSKGSDESFKTLPAPTEPPTVTTEAASAVSQTAATLNATVNPNGGEVSKCEFEYGTTTAYDKTAPCSSLPGNGSSAVAVSASISGLSANTTYHFRISATNPSATSKGSDESFKTLPAPTEPPTVTTEAASAVSQTAATLNATVNPNGGEVSKCEFEYGTTTAYDKTAPCSSLPGNGSSAVAVSASISGLSANTTYHFRISATNPSATSKGSDESFKTLPAPTEPPTVTTEAASAVSQTAATLNATVNPNGGEVSKCEFEYGTTTAYDKTAPCSSLPGNGSSAVAVSASISGLSANTTYHFRISATNPSATSKGSDESFKTLPAPTEPPTVTTEAASAVSQTAATLNATVNPNGGEVSKCEFEYGTTTAYDKTAPCSSLPGNGSSAVAVSASISGLSANTTYHFRISATNPSATSKGSDESFKTAGAGTIEPTTTSTSLSGAGQSGTTITVPEGTAVTDKATLAGTNSTSATGTVAYNVYSDRKCTKVVTSAGTPSVTAGVVPASNPETLSPGTYYWQAYYSGDSSNAASKSKCGSEVETVKKAKAAPKPTHVSTWLSGGGHWGGRITVVEETAVRDNATLSGANVAKATGTVSYKVYSDKKCRKLVASAGTVGVTRGTAPASDPETLSPGTYYWQAYYSGDSSNGASKSTCGSEVETVTRSKIKCKTDGGEGHFSFRWDDGQDPPCRRFG